MSSGEVGEQVTATQAAAASSGLGQRAEYEIVLIALGASLTFSFVSELITWFLIYRHDDYKKQVKEISEMQEQVDKMQEKMQYSLGRQSQAQQKAQ